MRKHTQSLVRNPFAVVQYNFPMLNESTHVYADDESHIAERKRDEGATGVFRIKYKQFK